MDYFLVHPDYIRLSKYFSFTEPIEQLIATSVEGYPIIVDWYYRESDIKRITDGYKDLVAKHQLSDFYDDLMLLTLTKVQEIEAVSYHYDYEASQINRSKELARILLTFNESKGKLTNSLVYKSLTETVKVQDPKVLSLIIDSLCISIAAGTYKALDFNYNLSSWLSIDETSEIPIFNVQAIKEAADQKPIDSKKLYKTQMADLCLYLRPYLIGETHLKSQDGVMLSHTQLDFYFDLLVLLDFIDPDTIQSDHLDYISSLLRNRIKALNA